MIDEPQSPPPRMSAGDPVLSVHDLQVTYTGGVRALTGVTLEVDAARVCAVVGMNGSGKSTFFNAIMGIVPARRGTIRVCGVDSATARRRGLVGYVPQNDAIDRHFPISVANVVAMGRYGFMGPLRRLRREDREAVDHALEVVGLADLRERPIGALSGGQRKRAFVARAVAQGAQLMLLDEPFAGVDYTSQDVIVDLMRQLATEGTTMLVSTHDLASIPSFADEVALLNRVIVGRGRPEDVLTPDHLVRAFTVPPDRGRDAGGRDAA